MVKRELWGAVASAVSAKFSQRPQGEIQSHAVDHALELFFNHIGPQLCILLPLRSRDYAAPET